MRSRSCSLHTCGSLMLTCGISFNACSLDLNERRRMAPPVVMVVELARAVRRADAAVPSCAAPLIERSRLARVDVLRARSTQFLTASRAKRHQQVGVALMALHHQRVTAGRPQ